VHELHNNLAYSVGLAPVVASDNTALSTAIVDMKGHASVEFVIMTGVLADADATFAVTMTHGDAVDSESAPTTITDSAAADADCLLGSLAGASFTFAADGAVKRIGYSPDRGAGKRFVRLTITPTGNSGNAPLAVLALRLPRTRPVA
jgi:hypothetical protein